MSRFCIFVYFLLAAKVSAGQKPPDSIDSKYYASGKIMEQVAFFRDKKIYCKGFYEDGGLKEASYYDSSERLIKRSSISHDRSEKKDVLFWKKGNVKQETYVDSTGFIVKEINYHRNGKLKEVSKLSDKSQSVYLVEIYSKKGVKQKTFYVYPKGTYPVLVN